MVNTIWKENFLIMCSKLCLNARDSGHFAQLLLICRNYSLQTLCGAPHNICNDEGKLLPLPPNRLYGPTDFFAGPFLIYGDGGEDLISLTDSQITKYEKKYHSPLIFLELYPKPITLKCTPELYAKCMGEEHQHDTQGNERDER